MGNGNAAPGLLSAIDLVSAQQGIFIAGRVKRKTFIAIPFRYFKMIQDIGPGCSRQRNPVLVLSVDSFRQESDPVAASVRRCAQADAVQAPGKAGARFKVFNDHTVCMARGKTFEQDKIAIVDAGTVHFGTAGAQQAYGS